MSLGQIFYWISVYEFRLMYRQDIPSYYTGEEYSKNLALVIMVRP